MRTAAALWIVGIGLLPRKEVLVVNGTPVATRRRRTWLNRNGRHRQGREIGGLVLPTRSMQTWCRASATDYVRVLRVGNPVTEARRAATTQRESGVARCYVVRRRSGLPLHRHLLGRPEHAQDVEPRQLPHVRLTPSPPQQLGEQIGELRDVFKPDRHLGDAVEVG